MPPPYVYCSIRLEAALNFTGLKNFVHPLIQFEKIISIATAVWSSLSIQGDDFSGSVPVDQHALVQRAVVQLMVGQTHAHNLNCAVYD